MLFLAPVCSATMGRNFTRRPFVDRVRNRRVTDDFVSPALSPALWGVYPKARNGARAGCTRPWRRKPPRFDPRGHQARPALAQPMGCTNRSTRAHPLTASTAGAMKQSRSASRSAGLQPGRAAEPRHDVDQSGERGQGAAPPCPCGATTAAPPSPAISSPAQPRRPTPQPPAHLHDGCGCGVVLLGAL